MQMVANLRDIVERMAAATGREVRWSDERGEDAQDLGVWDGLVRPWLSKWGRLLLLDSGRPTDSKPAEVYLSFAPKDCTASAKVAAAKVASVAAVQPFRMRATKSPEISAVAARRDAVPPLPCSSPQSHCS